ncbi:MAG: 6-aminopenicillanic acid acyl-transferase [Halomonas sp.]|uniref:C45 family autoproteolytic acyltransferase/hydolase n=1 Tax=Halomonas sp. TaxID=1486246 RepID=UPI001A0BBDBD|nr:C45 family peptidase [Halomonas sp.]MBE0489152.1 6-aminopenicillanic acid acyl-transferase [Halomonas sp.]
MVTPEETSRRLGWLAVGGSHHELGLALGRQGRRAVRERLMGTTLWREVTATRHLCHVRRLLAATDEHFPWVVEELEGLAEGLDLPLEKVAAWNCRGDLLASVPDGCTTLVLPGESPLIAHNEDGLPCLDGRCFLARLAPSRQPAFLTFCYPGSLPGHTFSLTAAGLVVTLNNLRLVGVAPELPRMVLSRALLAQPDLAAALALLETAPPGGGFHYTLAQAGDNQVLSVEVGGGRFSCRALATPALHANHCLHLDLPQAITASSADRQRQGEALIAAGVRDPLILLRDTSGPGLPIYRRAPDDPDEENTLATVLFRLTHEGVAWQVAVPGEAGIREGIGPVQGQW